MIESSSVARENEPENSHRQLHQQQQQRNSTERPLITHTHTATTTHAASGRSATRSIHAVILRSTKDILSGDPIRLVQAIQAIAAASNKIFRVGHQVEAGDDMAWLLHSLHLGTVSILTTKRRRIQLLVLSYRGLGPWWLGFKSYT